MLASNFTDKEKLLLKNIRLGAFFTFVAINLRFIVGDIIKPLILFDVIQPHDHSHLVHRYEFHTPNFPDMCGDLITFIFLGLAYLLMFSSNFGEIIKVSSTKVISTSIRLIPSTSFRDVIKSIMYTTHDADNKSQDSIRKIKDYTLHTKSIFYLAVIGFGLYFFSKYALTTGLEVFISQEEAEFGNISFILNILNNTIRLCSSIAFVHAYCKYLLVDKHVKIMLYTFFFTRSVLLTNLLGLFHGVDTEIDAPILDALLPCILIYSLCNHIYFLKYKKLQQRFT